MVDYANRFPNIFVDETGNLRLDNSDVSISEGAVTIGEDDVTINRTTTVNDRFFGEEGIYFKNEFPSTTGQPQGYVTLGFDAGQPLFISEDFNNVKYIDARSTRIADGNITLDPFDEFFIFNAGTAANPVIVTLPPSASINTRVYYIGGVGNYYGQIQSGNVDMVIFNTNTGVEAFRGTSLDLNAGIDLEFRLTLISTTPTVTQWSAGIN